MTAAKNPRRQLGQYRRMIRTQKALLRWVWLFWAIPLLLVAICFYFDWHWVAKTMSVIAVFAGVVQQFNDSARLSLYERQAAELEQDSET